MTTLVSSSSLPDLAGRARFLQRGFLVRDDGPEPPKGPQGPRLLDRVRQAIRTRHYSSSTEKAYAGWIRRFIFFHGKRHPAEMGEPEITQFLSSLATRGRVSASTQNQALSALLFLYREVLQRDLAWISRSRLAPLAAERERSAD